MESRAKILGHAAHPILIVFPLGLLATSFIFDLLAYFYNSATFATVGYWMIVSGVIGGFVAAVPGWIDWFAIPSNTRAKSVGLLHGVGNVIVLLLFIAAWYLRSDNPNYAAGVTELSLSTIAILLALGTGWLGGELVERLGVGVDEGANLNAPNSLSGKAADDTDNIRHGNHQRA